MTTEQREWLGLTDDERREVVKMRERTARREGFDHCKSLAISCIPGGTITPEDAQRIRETIAGLKSP